MTEANNRTQTKDTDHILAILRECLRLLDIAAPGGQSVDSRDSLLAARNIPLLLVVMALSVIVLGGTVRINDAGESCPDWPTCFGTLGFDISEAEQQEWYDANPDELDSRGYGHRYSKSEIFTEWAHRLVASLSGVVVIAGLLIARKQRDSLSDTNWSAAKLALVLVVSQGALGAVTVRMDNASWSVVAHLVLALIYVTGLLWWWLVWLRDEERLPNWARLPTGLAEEGEKLVRDSLAMLLLVVMFGAWVATGEGGAYNQGCSVGFWRGWPLCHGELIPTSQMGNSAVDVQFAHRLVVLIAFTVLTWYVVRLMRVAKGFEGGRNLTIMGHCGLGFFLLNIAVGGLYIVLAAGDSGFPEHLSLLHLIFGTLSFLSYALAWLVCKVDEPKLAD